MNLSILVRCSDDPRLTACLDSIDAPCDVVVTMTPNSALQKEVEKRGVPYALSPKGNPAATTMAGLHLCRHQRILLMDSDCVFLPRSIARMYQLSMDADIVRPRIDFKATDLSSYLTRQARNFQYMYCGYVYEPGLLIRLDRVLPLVGNYLFTRFAPFTPDGELDYRIRKAGLHSILNIVTDAQTTIRHDALSFTRHLWSYWRYGFSEASRMINLNQPVLAEVVGGLPRRHRLAWLGSYPPLTGPSILACDIVYLTSMIFFWFYLRINGGGLIAHEFERS